MHRGDTSAGSLAAPRHAKRAEFNQNNPLTALMPRFIYSISRPIYEGRLISVVRCWGGERWLVRASEMRRNDFTSGPSRLVPMRQPRITGAEVCVAKGAEAFGGQRARYQGSMTPRARKHPRQHMETPQRWIGIS